jgi:hypothetical protein
MYIMSLATQLIFALYVLLDVLLDTLVDALTACACQSTALALTLRIPQSLQF